MGSINIFKPLSTFLKAALLINLSNSNKFFLQKISGYWELHLGQLGLEASMLTIVLCCPPKIAKWLPVYFRIFSYRPQNTSKSWIIKRSYLSFSLVNLDWLLGLVFWLALEKQPTAHHSIPALVTQCTLRWDLLVFKNQADSLWAASEFRQGA